MPTIILRHLLHNLDFKFPFRKDLHQSRVLLFQQAQPLHVISGHAGKPLAPRADLLFVDSMLVGHLGHRAAVSFAQDAHNLLFRKSSRFYGALVVERDTYLNFGLVRKCLAGHR